MAVYIGYLLLAGLQIPLFWNTDSLGKAHFNKKAYLILCCAELVILVGIRGYTVGADTAVYLKAIDYYGSLSLPDLLTAKLVWPFDFEWGYFALTKLCVLLGMGKTAFLFVIAIIMYVPVFITIKKYSPMPYISILCYFAFGLFSYSLGVFRQMMAISILLCGFHYVTERKLWKYLITVGIAMLFHTTAIVAIGLYILYGIKWERFGWAVFGLEFLFVVSGRPIVLIVAKLFPQYAGYVGGAYDQQGGSYVMLMLLNAILIAALWSRKRRDPHARLVICALMIAVCLQALGYSMAIFGRVVLYFSVYLMLAIPNIISDFNRKWRISIAPIVMICLFILIYVDIHGNDYITPYYMFFQKIPIQ